MALNFPADPAGQTPENVFSPTSTPEATTNGATYFWNGTGWTGAATPVKGNYLSLVAGAPAQTVETTELTTFTGVVVSELTTEFSTENTLVTKSWVDANDVVPGKGMIKTGFAFDVVSANSSRIVVNLDDIDLVPTGVTAGTYTSTTVDEYGRVMTATTPTTFAGYSISTTSADLAASLTDETGVGFAVFSGSPALTGVPTVPTADPDDNTTQIANTEYVDDAIFTSNILTDTHIFVGNASNVSTDVELSGDATMANTGVITITTGAVTSSKILDNTIVNVDINSGAAIAHSKLADLASAQVMIGNASNVPTDTAISGDVTLSNTGVVDIIDDVNLGGNPTTTTQTDSDDSTRIATTEFVQTRVQNAIQGLSVKQSVQAATVGDIVLDDPQTVDGIVLVVGNQVLVKDQNTPAENGIYVVSTGPWSRAPDANTWDKLVGAFTFVEAGTVNNDAGFTTTIVAGGTLGTTPIPWAQFSGAGQIIAGDGLIKVGNEIDVVTASQSRIVVGSDSIDLATTGIAAGVYTEMTTDVYGRIISASNPTTFPGYHILDTSANFRSVITDPTGSGSVVFNTSPELTGLPTAPTAATDNKSALIASTEYVMNTALPQSGGVVTGALAVIGTTTLSNLQVLSQTITNELSVTTNATVGGTLTVAGLSTFDSLSVINDVAIGGNTAVLGNQNVVGTFSVTGATTLTTLATSQLATLDSLSVTNNATVGGTLGVTGTTTTNSINATGTVAVTGDIAATGTITSVATTSSSGSTVATTKGYVDSEVAAVKVIADAALPKAGGTMTGNIIFAANQSIGTDSVPGILTISSSVASTGTSTAASSSAVKQAYDRGTQGITDAANALSAANAAQSTANAALPKAGGTMTGNISFAAVQEKANVNRYGITILSNSVSSTSADVAATSAAAKSAYDRGSTGITNASNAQSTANAAMPKAGGNFTGNVTFNTNKIVMNASSGDITCTTISAAAKTPATAGGNTLTTKSYTDIIPSVGTGKTTIANDYVVVTSSGQTVTLPSSPVNGQKVMVAVGGEFLNTTVARGNSNIMGIAQNITLDIAYASLTFTFVGGSQGWNIA